MCKFNAQSFSSVQQPHPNWFVTSPTGPSTEGGQIPAREQRTLPVHPPGLRLRHHEPWPWDHTAWWGNWETPLQIISGAEEQVRTGAVEPCGIPWSSSGCWEFHVLLVYLNRNPRLKTLLSVRDVNNRQQWVHTEKRRHLLTDTNTLFYSCCQKRYIQY